MILKERDDRRDTTVDKVMSEVPALSVSDVSVSYGKVKAVSNVSFDVKQGVTFGLMGLNGAGKTTLIKTILGLRRQDKGGVSLFGYDSVCRHGKKSLVYLPERFDPPFFLTGMEFLSFSASLYGVSCSREYIEEVSLSLALDPMVLKNRIQSYSKGMRQKLGLMATLLSKSPLMVLDEPMSGLDPQARVCVKGRLREAQREGCTVFLSSHILSDMDEICGQVAILHKGHLSYIGTPQNLKKEYNEENIERAFLSVIEAE